MQPTPPVPATPDPPIPKPPVPIRPPVPSEPPLPQAAGPGEATGPGRPPVPVNPPVPSTPPSGAIKPRSPPCRRDRELFLRRRDGARAPRRLRHARLGRLAAQIGGVSRALLGDQVPRSASHCVLSCCALATDTPCQSTQVPSAGVLQLTPLLLPQPDAPHPASATSANPVRRAAVTSGSPPRGDSVPGLIQLTNTCSTAVQPDRRRPVGGAAADGRGRVALQEGSAPGKCRPDTSEVPPRNWRGSSPRLRSGRRPPRGRSPWRRAARWSARFRWWAASRWSYRMDRTRRWTDRCRTG